MAQQWYYGQGTIKYGPFSALQLQDLAGVGKILRTDTVWKEGIELGAPAARVKHLFAVPAIVALSLKIEKQSTPVPETKPNEPPAVDPGVHAKSGAEPVVEQPNVPIPPANPTKQPERKIRALVIRGAKLMGQDGHTVQFKKICTTCAHEDGTRSSMTIRVGMTRIAYYCPKCRKSRPIEIQGIH